MAILWSTNQVTLLQKEIGLIWPIPQKPGEACWLLLLHVRVAQSPQFCHQLRLCLNYCPMIFEA